MKIVYVCLAGTYTDGFSYQDNILSKYHKLAGNAVTILTTQWKTVPGKAPEKCKVREYINEYGIKIIRLQTKYNAKLNNRFKRFKHLYETIEHEKPDVIFLHGIQTWDLDVVVKYVKKHKSTILFADNHADWLNSGKTWFSKKILHQTIYRNRIQKALPYIEKVYGVVPLRVEFLKRMYGIQDSKCEYLPLGGDDELIAAALEPAIREKKRMEYACQSKTVIITGGKIDNNKPQILTLMKAVNSIRRSDIKLLVFGSVIDEFKNEFHSQLSEYVAYIGWRKSDEIYSEYAAADIVAFPGLHSVLWEQAVAMGKPCIFKHIDGFTHVDLGGNCTFFDEDSEKKYVQVIEETLIKLPQMKIIAERHGMEKFSYKEIARKAIEYDCK